MSGMMRFASAEEFDKFLKNSTARLHPESRRTQPATPAPGTPQDRGPFSTPGTAPRREAPAHRPAPGLAGQKESEIERRFAQQIRAAGLPEPEREYYHLVGRDFRLDFAWPDRKLGVEIQGMAHRIKGKFNADIEKRALALLAGWTILEVNGAAVRDERGIGWLQQLIERR